MLIGYLIKEFYLAYTLLSGNTRVLIYLPLGVTLGTKIYVISFCVFDICSSWCNVALAILLFCCLVKRFVLRLFAKQTQVFLFREINKKKLLECLEIGKNKLEAPKHSTFKFWYCMPYFWHNYHCIFMFFSTFVPNGTGNMNSTIVL